MVAYAFKTEFHPAILAGAKDLTLRQEGKKRHARIGEEIQFRAGRTGPVFARATCVLRASLVFSPRGLQRVLHPTFMVPGDQVFRLLQASEQHMHGAEEYRERLARRDGFDAWADFAAWHERHGVVKDGACWRELIVWSGVVGA